MLLVKAQPTCVLVRSAFFSKELKVSKPFVRGLLKRELMLADSNCGPTFELPHPTYLKLGPRKGSFHLGFDFALGAMSSILLTLFKKLVSVVNYPSMN
jgi:hypothetical protein